jgi:hypothetical protein
LLEISHPLTVAAQGRETFILTKTGPLKPINHGLYIDFAIWRASLGKKYAQCLEGFITHYYRSSVGPTEIRKTTRAVSRSRPVRGVVLIFGSVADLIAAGFEKFQTPKALPEVKTSWTEQASLEPTKHQSLKFATEGVADESRAIEGVGDALPSSPLSQCCRYPAGFVTAVIERIREGARLRHLFLGTNHWPASQTHQGSFRY